MNSGFREMFADGSSLRQSKGGALAQRKVAVAVSAMLLDASGRDGDYAPEELEIIKESLDKQMQIAPEIMNSVLQEAQEMCKNRVTFDTGVKSVREAFSSDQLVIVLAMVWQVIIADGAVGTTERQYADSVRSRLALTAEQNREAEKLAKSAARRRP